MLYLKVFSPKGVNVMNITLKKNQTVLIIGDIHGCYDEMIELINSSKIEIGKDIIITVGDIIDRGYKTYETINFFKQTPNAFSIMGNHEIKHIKKMILNKSLFDKQDFTGEIQRLMLTEKEYLEILDFISTFPLYINLELATGEKYLIVHAGWSNNIEKNNLRLNITDDGKIDQDIRYILGIGSQGRKGFDNSSDPWFNSLKTNYKVVFGHSKYENVETGKSNNVFGIDTGCYEGRKLSGLLLPSEEIVEVKAKKDYYKEILNETLDIVYLSNYYKLNWKDKETIMKHSKSSKLQEKVELDFKDLTFMTTYIKNKADEYKNKIGEIDDEMKQQIGMNWNKNNRFPEEISREVKKAFFGKFSTQDLFKYNIEEIRRIIKIISD